MWEELLDLLIYGVCIADYVLFSIGMYTLAKRRGISLPGLVWVPLVRYWTMGKMVNEYEAQNGIKRKWHVTLLVLALLSVAICILTIVLLIGVMVAAIALYYDSFYEQVENLMLYPILSIIALVVVERLLTVFTSIGIFKILESTVPQKAVKYLMLYLLVPLARGICFLKIRNLGHPYPAPEGAFLGEVSLEEEPPVLEEPDLPLDEEEPAAEDSKE